MTVKQPVEVVRQPSGVISVTTTTTTTASVAQQAPAQPIPTNNDENVAPTPLHVDMPPAIIDTIYEQIFCGTLPSQPAALSPAVPPASGSSTPESNLVKRFSISSSTSSQQEALTLKVAPAQANSAVDVVNAVVQQQASALTSANAQQQPQQQQQLTVAASVAATLVAPPSSATLILPPPSLTTAPAIGNSAPASATLPAANEIDPNALRQVLRIASTQDARSQLPQSAIIPAWLGASPLGRAPITPEHDAQLNLLEHALTRTPLQMDSEKPRSYLPKMPCATASYYPQSPPANADTLEYYLRLSPETLFFTFYYMEGTYVYFDFEKWSQRKKEQFTFEYRYLEDKDFD
uniref:NOT2/NOT3/NOT5 C-terminal domain-containing protein n=1 Tax=Ascaris lumbricoides TaxID=6252 RepID=A0A9J2PH86_ASCLU